MFRYIASSTSFISNAQFIFAFASADVISALKVVEDSEFLFVRLCLLVEEMLASTLFQSES
jgi:hypothetical protein